MKKAAIYNPYLDTLGGGERYTMAVATLLIKKGYKVYVEWKDNLIKKRLESRFGVNLKELNFVQSVKKGDAYDVCFWLSDGSIPLLRARNNILHFQVPFNKVNGKSLINKTKLFRINSVVCNSKFTKSVIDKEYGVKSAVVYPPVDVKRIKPKRKQDMILYVGRFSLLAQSKNQDVLIRVFKKLVDRELDNWELILVGGVEVGADAVLKKINKMVKGYPITILESPSFSSLKDLYGKAKIFWSASGYGVDEFVDPVKVEHFGIAVVEAMTAGCVPIVFNAGGHKEIVKNDENGYLWNSTSQLIRFTKKTINDPKLMRQLVNNSKKVSKSYSYERFEEEFGKLI